jgi:hypothetical protein
MFIIARPDEEEGVWILPIAGEEVRVSPLTYGGYFKLNDAVYAAHREYGEMMYGDDEVGKLVVSEAAASTCAPNILGAVLLAKNARSQSLTACFACDNSDQVFPLYHCFKK